MNVLVLGGTRFIGPHVVRQLVEAGHETALFNRGQSRPDISLPQGVRIIRGDRRRLADYRESFRSFAPDVVIDLFPYTEAEAQAVMTVFDGIAGRLVAVSSCDVYRAFGRVNRLEDGPAEAIRRTVAWESVHPPADVPPGMFDYAAEDELLARMGMR